MDHAQPCVGTAAQQSAMSHACTTAQQWTPHLPSTLRTACRWASQSALSSALPPPVRLTCGRLLPGAAALVACRTGLCPASASRVVQLMLRWVAFTIRAMLMMAVIAYAVGFAVRCHFVSLSSGPTVTDLCAAMSDSLQHPAPVCSLLVSVCTFAPGTFAPSINQTTDCLFFQLH